MQFRYLFFKAVACFLFIIKTTPVHSTSIKKPVEFAIVINAYNNKERCVKALQSVAGQTYKNWIIYYMNDGSTDQSDRWISGTVRSLDLSKKCKIINFKSRNGFVSNLHTISKDIDPTKIIVEISGADWLASDQVLEKLAMLYSDQSVWLTHGSCTVYPLGWPINLGIPLVKEDDQSKRIQLTEQMVLPLRTYYAKLFQLIKKKDLTTEGGFTVLSDSVNYMLPMIEMASKGHVKHIDEIQYVCNLLEPTIERKHDVRKLRQQNLSVLNLPAYEPLDTLFNK